MQTLSISFYSTAFQVANPVSTSILFQNGAVAVSGLVDVVSATSYYDTTVTFNGKTR